MRTKLLLFALISCLLPNLSFSAVECTDKAECWPNGSAMRTGILLSQELKSAELALTRKHEELMKLVSSSSIDEITVDARLLSALKAQQVAWRKYRAEECELIGSLTGAALSWPSTYATRCEVNHTQLRLRRVSSAISCIEKKPVEKRIFEQNSCLQQLAPLTNRL